MAAGMCLMEMQTRSSIDGRLIGAGESVLPHPRIYRLSRYESLIFFMHIVRFSGSYWEFPICLRRNLGLQAAQCLRHPSAVQCQLHPDGEHSAGERVGKYALPPLPHSLTQKRGVQTKQVISVISKT